MEGKTVEVRTGPAEKEAPAVPIPTYMWYDVHRSREKGLYPWTHLDKPPYDEKKWLEEKDHEYEVVTPKEPPPPPILKVSDFDSKLIGKEVEPEPTPEVTRAATPTPAKTYERRVIKIPNEDAIIIPLHGDSDEELNPDRYESGEVTIQRLQDEIEEKYFNRPEPQSTDLYQPQMPQPQSESLQSRIKTGAGQIKTRLRSLSKPNITLPERPKIKLPDRPKMKFERPQFLKEKPKFLKEKPKFLSERPKFLSEKPKFMTERPKFHLPDRSQFKLPEKFRFERAKKAEKVKLKKPNPSSVRRPLRDAVTVSSGSSRNLFETLKSRTYPRFLNRKKREKAARLEPGTSLDTESSLPSTPPDRRRTFAPYRDVKFLDEDPVSSSDPKMDEPDAEEGFDENTAPFHESYIPGAVNLDDVPIQAKMETTSDVGDSDREQHSSGSSSMRHRAGVIEEIDSDEFFLRQKGLSREDVDVSRYLSKEIREAFRSPVNALAHMDSQEDDYERDDPEMRFEPIPSAPTRKKSTKSTPDKDSESNFNTFPMRPTRRKQSEPDIEKIRKPPRKYRSKSDNRGSMPSLNRSRSQGIETDEAPLPPTRRKSTKSLNQSVGGRSATDVRDVSAHREMAPPVAPLRKSRSRGTSLDDRTSRGADSTDLPQDMEEPSVGEEMEEEEELEQVHRDQEFEQPEEEDMEEMEEVHRDVQVFRAEPVSRPDSVIPGYATVDKDRKVKPPRPPQPPTRTRKEQIQSQLLNIRNQGVNFFFTYPRRAMKSLHKPPVRPVRNYSTLGPSRPPRRNRVFREPVYVEELDNEPSREEKLELNLQSGEVVQRMKDRPLPAPPRPPRKTKEDEEESIVIEHFAPLQGSVKSESILTRAPQEVPMTNTSQQTSFDAAEVSVSIQTDPLPDGFIVDDSQCETEVESDTLRSQRTVEEVRPAEPVSYESYRESPPPLPERSIPSLLRSLPQIPIAFPDKLHLSELEVDKLSVNELSASKIKVTDIEGMTLQISELTSATGTLTLNGVELPPDFIKNLMAQIPVPPPARSRETTPHRQLMRVLTPPPPIVIQHTASFLETSAASAQVANTTETIPKPKTTKSRGRKSPTRVIDDSEDELASVTSERERRERERSRVQEESTDKKKLRENIEKEEESTAAPVEVVPTPVVSQTQSVDPPVPSTSSQSSHTPSTSQIPQNPTPVSPSALQLTAQLLSIWYRNVSDGASSLLDGINSIFPDGEKRRDAQSAAIMLVILIAGLIIVGFGFDNSVHHHHWDYVPPR